MDNQNGQSDINIGTAGNSGTGSIVNIGLQNLSYNNQHGQHDINVKEILNSGTKSITNVGRMLLDN